MLERFALTFPGSKTGFIFCHGSWGLPIMRQKVASGVHETSRRREHPCSSVLLFYAHFCAGTKASPSAPAQTTSTQSASQQEQRYVLCENVNEQGHLLL